MYVLPKGLFEELFAPIKNGFFIGIAIIILFLFFMMVKGNKKPYVLLIFHFIFLAIAGYLFFDALNPAVNPELPQSVIFNEVKIRFTITGVAWIISMIFLVIGIKQFKSKIKD
ncbi:hypothetical protein [Bacillus sp. 1P02SD]|uniref:hypothetical protein n=1 Tax=Bacillus sp. 1P02SD TaxID=3132264 RepID=UPI0039A2DF9C